MRKLISALLITFFSSLMFISTNAVAELNNKEAMQGIKEVKILYDMRKSHPNVMLAYLKGIESNRTNFIKEGVKPTQRIIFIADAVKFITTEPSDDVLINHGQALDEIADTIAHLQKLGVKMEVCAAATSFHQVDNATVLPGIKVVRSGFLSVIGWQEQGYRLVPVY